MLIIVKCCGDYHTSTVKGVIVNHFLLLPNVLHNKIISEWQCKKDRNCVEVKKQLREQEGAVTTQLPLTRFCWAVKHLCLLMLPISIMASFLPTNLCHFLWWLLHCATYLYTHIKPGIAMFWLQQVCIRKMGSHLKLCRLADGYNQLQNYVWLSDSKLHGVIVWCVLLTDPRMMMYLFYKGKENIKCLQVI